MIAVFFDLNRIFVYNKLLELQLRSVGKGQKSPDQPGRRGAFLFGDRVGINKKRIGKEFTDLLEVTLYGHT